MQTSEFLTNSVPVQVRAAVLRRAQTLLAHGLTLRFNFEGCGSDRLRGLPGSTAVVVIGPQSLVSVLTIEKPPQRGAITLLRRSRMGETTTIAATASIDRQTSSPAL